MIELSQLLDPSRIRCQCDIKSKKRAFETLAELLAPTINNLLPQQDLEELEDGEQVHTDRDIFEALFTRERLGCTGLGHGVALPHSRMENLEEPIAALITLSNGVDFEAPDDQPVDLLVGLLVPENCNDEHLKILAAMAKHFSLDSFRDEVREFSANQNNDLYAFLKQQAPAA